MQPLFEHRLELAGYETRALELEGSGPPLLLLHGYADSADTWRLMLDRLGRLDRRALAVDMPGFGTCAELSDGEPILRQLGDFARAAVEHLAPGGGAVVVGNSLGGCVGMRLAEERDLGLAGVVPIAPAGLDMARWFRVIEGDVLVRLILASPLPDLAVRTAVAEIYRRLVFRHPDRVERLVISNFCSHVGSRRVASRLLSTGRRLLPELKDPFRLDRIECPVLLLWGENDLMVFQTGAERVLETVDESRLEVVDDCGHCPQLECPDRVTDLLVDFPARLAQAA